MAQKTKSSVISPLGAAALGVAVGAGAVILSDEKRRKAISQKVDTVVKQGREMLADFEERVDEVKTTGQKRLAHELKKAKRQVDTTSKALSRKTA